MRQTASKEAAARRELIRPGRHRLLCLFDPALVQDIQVIRVDLHAHELAQHFDPYQGQAIGAAFFDEASMAAERAAAHFDGRAGSRAGGFVESREGLPQLLGAF